ISEQLLAGGYVATPLFVVMGLVKLAETPFVELVQRYPVHFKPPAEICHERTLCVQRYRGIALATKQCRKPANVGCQWAGAGMVRWRGLAAVPINHRPSPQTSGEIPALRRQPNNAELSTLGPKPNYGGR